VFSRPTDAPDWIGIIEAAYALDRPDDVWLGGLLAAAQTCLDEGKGLVAFTYDASHATALRVSHLASAGVPPQRLQAYLRVSEELAAIPGFLQRTYRTLLCGTMSEADAAEYDWRRAAVACGVGDTLAVNGLDPSGKGCLLGVFLPEETRLRPRRRQLLSYVATHLANAYRLRERMRAAAQTPVASLDGAGRVVERAGAGDERLDAALSRAGAGIAAARGPLRFAGAEDAVSRWQGLVQRRFTLVDGARAGAPGGMVAFDNQPQIAGFSKLAEREREVVAFLALGRSTKVIAYELGISDSTVRVLLRRARGKLNVKTRGELIAALQSAGPPRDP
jgi:DNA-binding CsgD family transcriptional regulator